MGDGDHIIFYAYKRGGGRGAEKELDMQKEQGAQHVLR